MKESKNTNEPGVSSSFKLPDAAVDKMTFAPQMILFSNDFMKV